MDNRLRTLTDWVRKFPGLTGADPQPVSGDASFRRYFRVFSDAAGTGHATPFIVMDAPPEHEDCKPFVDIARHWHDRGIPVPEIYQQDLDQGLLLLEDFGDDLLLGMVSSANADTLYRHALEGLVKIQQITDVPGQPLPPYDSELLDREMALFPDWLLTRKLGLTLDDNERALLDTTFSFLRENALAQPRVTVHRDYHSRNLLVRPGQPYPGIIDFQDAVHGPITYDLASLLKDCYICWPDDQIEQWKEYFRLQTFQAGLHNADHDTFTLWFELMGMQRHLKAAGIFARLAIRDGKTDYLGDIPRTVNYLVRASARQPALREFHEWLTDTVVPAIERVIGTTGTTEKTEARPS